MNLESRSPKLSGLICRFYSIERSLWTVLGLRWLDKIDLTVHIAHCLQSTILCSPILSFEIQFGQYFTWLFFAWLWRPMLQDHGWQLQNAGTLTKMVLLTHCVCFDFQFCIIYSNKIRSNKMAFRWWTCHLIISCADCYLCSMSTTRWVAVESTPESIPGSTPESALASTPESSFLAHIPRSTVNHRDLLHSD